MRNQIIQAAGKSTEADKHGILSYRILTIEGKDDEVQDW